MNSKKVYISYANFHPYEIPPEARKKYYDELGNPLYVVKVNQNTRQYQRDNMRLITDPEYYSRIGYTLYNQTMVEGGTLTVDKYLIDKIGLVNKERVYRMVEKKIVG